MSRVTNVILTGLGLERGIIPLQAWLKDQGVPPLVKVDKAAGGNKYMEVDVYMASYNWFNSDALISAVFAQKWSSPWTVQLFLLEPHEDKFEVYDEASTPEEVENPNPLNYDGLPGRAKGIDD